jgi:hypothetical protein
MRETKGLLSSSFTYDICDHGCPSLQSQCHHTCTSYWQTSQLTRQMRPLQWEPNKATSLSGAFQRSRKEIFVVALYFGNGKSSFSIGPLRLHILALCFYKNKGLIGRGGNLSSFMGMILCRSTFVRSEAYMAGKTPDR